MRNKTTFFFASTAAIILSLTNSGCTNDATDRTSTPIPLSIVKVDGDIAYQFYSYQTYKDGFVFDQNGTRHLYALDTFRTTFVYFNLPPDGTAGNVRFSGGELEKFPGGYNDNTNPDVKPDAKFKTWIVSGSGSIPAITDSVKGSVSQIAFTTPSNAADVSLSSPINVTWSPLGDTNEVVSIEIVLDKNGSSTVFQTMANTGSVIIPASTMATLSPGRCTMVLRRGNYKVDTATNGKKYIIVAWTQAERDVNLTN